jgi:hypothetical protein
MGERIENNKQLTRIVQVPLGLAKSSRIKMPTGHTFNYRKTLFYFCVLHYM